jgi:hypothetical protein
MDLVINPSSINIMDDGGQAVLGGDDAHGSAQFQSHTIVPKIYSTAVGETELTVLDTAGVDDNRGDFVKTVANHLTSNILSTKTHSHYFIFWRLNSKFQSLGVCLATVYDRASELYNLNGALSQSMMTLCLMGVDKKSDHPSLLRIVENHLSKFDEYLRDITMENQPTDLAVAWAREFMSQLVKDDLKMLATSVVDKADLQTPEPRPYVPNVEECLALNAENVNSILSEYAMEVDTPAISMCGTFTSKIANATTRAALKGLNSINFSGQDGEHKSLTEALSDKKKIVEEAEAGDGRGLGTLRAELGNLEDKVSCSPTVRLGYYGMIDELSSFDAFVASLVNTVSTTRNIGDNVMLYWFGGKAQFRECITKQILRGPYDAEGVPTNHLETSVELVRAIAALIVQIPPPVSCWPDILEHYISLLTRERDYDESGLPLKSFRFGNDFDIFPSRYVQMIRKNFAVEASRQALRLGASMRVVRLRFIPEGDHRPGSSMFQPAEEVQLTSGRSMPLADFTKTASSLWESLKGRAEILDSHKPSKDAAANLFDKESEIIQFVSGIAYPTKFMQQDTLKRGVMETRVVGMYADGSYHNGLSWHMTPPPEYDSELSLPSNLMSMLINGWLVDPYDPFTRTLVRGVGLGSLLEPLHQYIPTGIVSFPSLMSNAEARISFKDTLTTTVPNTRLVETTRDMRLAAVPIDKTGRLQWDQVLWVRKQGQGWKLSKRDSSPLRLMIDLNNPFSAVSLYCDGRFFGLDKKEAPKGKNAFRNYFSSRQSFTITNEPTGWDRFPTRTVDLTGPEPTPFYALKSLQKGAVGPVRVAHREGPLDVAINKFGTTTTGSVLVIIREAGQVPNLLPPPRAAPLISHETTLRTFAHHLRGRLMSRSDKSVDKTLTDLANTLSDLTAISDELDEATERDAKKDVHLNRTIAYVDEKWRSPAVDVKGGLPDPNDPEAY